jgi:uncharacterized protein (DUF2267 family)
MRYDEFISHVAERAGGSDDVAAALTRATLMTLGERITQGEADDLASQLPQELKGWLLTREGPEKFDLAEFERRVAERAAVSKDAVEPGVAAVFATLREAVTPGEFDDVLAQLPKEFQRVAA